MVPAPRLMGRGPPGPGVPDTGTWVELGQKLASRGLLGEGSVDEP